MRGITATRESTDNLLLIIATYHACGTKSIICESRYKGLLYVLSPAASEERQSNRWDWMLLDRQIPFSPGGFSVSRALLVGSAVEIPQCWLSSPLAYSTYRLGKQVAGDELSREEGDQHRYCSRSYDGRSHDSPYRKKICCTRYA